jgi:hypothetical protein
VRMRHPHGAAFQTQLHYLTVTVENIHDSEKLVEALCHKPEGRELNSR